MKGYQIESYLTDSVHFNGCFSKSNLPTFPDENKLPISLIIHNNGHYVAILLREDYCLYFDSFANKMSDLILRCFITGD